MDLINSSYLGLCIVAGIYQPRNVYLGSIASGKFLDMLSEH
jgi:hypothetical protein